jgi:hypothetical protein
MMIFYDAVTPANIPTGAHACLYADGLYKATPAQAERFAAVRWITVVGGSAAAAYAGCIDFENGNPAYLGGALRSWVAARQAHGMRARVYCNRSDLATVRMRCAELTYEVWLATLDGNKLRPNYTTHLWAVQYQGGLTAKVDANILYGQW